ncbi:MAG: accessory Sec system glycosyltransferase GtfA [Lachnospiraceae bacterium]|nr:accessory Sec system glycosyltransferase GtfA [Lachnospiraceae bacterium]
MIYNFNLGIGWASSGVEYAQSYRAVMLRNIGAGARFVFTDMISTENIEHLTKNIGFLDSEIIWLYTFFTDYKIAPVSFMLDDLKKTLPTEEYTYSRDGKTGKLVFQGSNSYYAVYFADEKSERVHRVEIVSGGCLIRKDFYTYGRVFSEYYAPLDKKAHMYLRRFFNEDGTVAYEEINDDGNVMYQFPDKLLCSKEELVGHMVSGLKLTKEDVVLIDRTTGIGQTILQNAGDAKVGIVIHADHFSEGSTDQDYILWNNYYEYAFAMYRHIDFYVTATEEQNRLLKEQFLKYKGVEPNVYTIPVGSLDELKYPTVNRKPYSILTASRLATEKHIDWIIEAVAKARRTVPQLTLDIYGKGSEEQKLKELIKKLGAENYIILRGQQNLKEVYQDYELYLSGSMSEGFGLTLMEAVGAGLPIIGFDVRYGNPTFIEEGKNGYLIPVDEHMTAKQKIEALTNRVIRLFTEADLESFHEHSYRKAEEFLTKGVEQKWKKIVG